MPQKTCCFTGHRVIPPEKFMYVRARLDEEVAKAVEQGFDTFCTGGALGFDTQAALSVLAAKLLNPKIKLVLILPCKEQSKSWSELDRQNYEMIISRADEVTYVSESYTRYCMHMRNCALVDRSSRCIAYLEQNTGGTAFTTKYAKKKGVEVINIIE